MKSKKDLKSIGLSITATTVLTAILLLILNIYVSQNYSSIGNSVYILVGSVLVFLLGGVVAEAVVSNTKNPLSNGLASSAISMFLSIMGTAIIAMSTITSLNEPSQLILSSILALITMNTTMLFAAILIASIAVLVYWFIFSRNKELSWVKTAIEESRNWKKYLASLITVLILAGLSIALGSMAVGGYLVIGIVSATWLFLFSFLIPYTIDKLTKRNYLREFISLIIFQIILAAAVGIPALLLFFVIRAIPDILLLGVSTIVILAIALLCFIFIVLYPYEALEKGITDGLKSTVRMSVRRFFNLVGKLVIIGLVLALIDVIQLAIAFPLSLINEYLGIGTIVVISAYAAELGILLLENIRKSIR